jgi:hypothetical protein
MPTNDELIRKFDQAIATLTEAIGTMVATRHEFHKKLARLDQIQQQHTKLRDQLTFAKEVVQRMDEGEDVESTEQELVDVSDGAADRVLNEPTGEPA